MKKWITSILLITMMMINVLGVSGLTVYGESQTSAENVTQEKAQDNLYKVQLPFIENEGQVPDSSVHYFAQTFAGTVFCTNSEIGYALKSEDGTQAMSVIEKFAGAKDSAVTGDTPVSTKINYFSGNDRSHWKKNVAAYQTVSYGEIYDSITLNLKAYGNNVEKVFHVARGGDPAKIQLTVYGADKLSVDADGQLVFQSGEQSMKLTKPVAYQEIDGKHVDVPVAYEVEGTGYGFTLGAYDKTHELVIDPLLASTLIGGDSGWSDLPQKMDEEAPGKIMVHGDNIYVIGSGDLNFPGIKLVSSAPEPGIIGIRSFPVIFKFNKDLSELQAATFITSGDAKTREGASSIMFDADGNVIICGCTHSPDFPVTSGTYQQGEVTFEEHHPNGGSYWYYKSKCYIMKMKPDLSDILTSAVFGGSDFDGISSMVLADDGSIYILGGTQSADFPVTSILQNSLSGEYYTLSNHDYTTVADDAYQTITSDVYKTELSGSIIKTTDIPNYKMEAAIYIAMMSKDLTKLEASTLLGYGSASRMSLDPNGDIIIAGRVDCDSGYPSTADAYQTKYNLNQDCFVSKLSPDLKKLKASTFLGTVNSESMDGMVVNPKNGDVYITGTSSEYFPVTAGAYDTDNTKGSRRMFIAKMNNGLTGLMTATFLGCNNMYPRDIDLDSNNNVYVCGMMSMPYWYNSEIFPTTKGAYRTQPCPGSTGFVSKMDSDLSTLKASTYVGWVDVKNIAIDDATNSIFVISAASSNMNGEGTPLTLKTATRDYPTTDADMDYPVVVDQAAQGYGYPRIAGIFDFPVTEDAYQKVLKGGQDIGISRFDLDLSADTDAPSLEDMQLTASNVQTTSLTLNWTDPASTDNNSDIIRYRIFKGWEPIANVDSSTRTFDVTRYLTQGIEYAFKIEAQDSSGKWSTDGPSLTVKTKSGDTVAPTWPEEAQLYVTELTSSSISLRWDAATDNNEVKEYRIYKPASNDWATDGKVSLVYTIPADQVKDGQITFDATYLESSLGYHIIVKAVDEDNNETSDYLYKLIYTHIPDTDCTNYIGAYLTTLGSTASSTGRKITGIKDMPVHSTIKVAFTKDMTSNDEIWAANHDHIKLVDSTGNTVPTILSRLAGETENIFITPVSDLINGETYTIKMDAYELVAAYSTHDMRYGISEDDPTDIPFTVIGEGVALAGPAITYLSPAYDGTNSPAGVAVDQSITVAFSAPVDPDTISGAKLEAVGSQEEVPVDITFNEFNTAATITPKTSLDYGVHYRLTLPDTLADADGNKAEGSHALEFYTQGLQVDTAYTLTLDGQTGHFTGKLINKSESQQIVSVYVVARGGIGAREDHGGTVLGFSQQDITADKNENAAAELDFTVPEDIASDNIYVDVYVWDTNGQYPEAQPAHFTYKLSN